ncbi:MAG: branched-chain amino acid ABC transporter permease [Oceanospirillales bacterium]|nr:branched-chain amino acid ABC transporter permease [Oceanospirillales bacterium]
MYSIFIVSGLALGAIYALSGVGIVLLYRSTGVFNVAYGAIGATSAMLLWQLNQFGWPDPLSWLTAVVVSMSLSILYGRALAPLLSFRDSVVKSVATIGFALVLLGLMNWQWPEIPRRLTLPSDAISFTLFDVNINGTRALALLLAVIATLAIGQFLSRSRTGLWMRALANNRSLSGVLGIDVLRVETVAWLISGFLAGVSGILLGDLVRLNATVLTFLIIPAAAAAIIGRLQSLPLTLVGGLAIGVIESLLTLYKPISPIRSVTPFLVAVIVLLWIQRNQTLTFAEKD